MFATPLLTFIIWLFYSKRPFNYTEHLVENLYISGYAALAYVLFFIPLGLLLPIEKNWVLIGFFVFEMVYRSVFYYHFMARKNRSGALQAVSISSIVILFWAFSSYSLVYYYIANGLWGLFP